MTVFATYAVTNAESARLLFHWHGKRVAGQALRRFFCLGQIQDACHALCDAAAQDFDGFGVAVTNDPCAVLILEHAGFLPRLHAAVAA